MSWQKIFKGAYQTDGKKYRFVARRHRNGDHWVVTAAELQDDIPGVRHTIGVFESTVIGREATLTEVKRIIAVMIDTETPAHSLTHTYRDADILSGPFSSPQGSTS